MAWSLNLHHPYDPARPVDSLEVAARAINNIIGGATVTGTSGSAVVQPGLESSPANCTRYTGSPALKARRGFPSVCARPVTVPAGQAALVADIYQKWIVGATPQAAQDASVLFENANNPGDPQVQAILQHLRNAQPAGQPGAGQCRPAPQQRPSGQLPARQERGERVNAASKPRWQQAAALVSLGAGGAVTGFSFVPGMVADPTAPPITQIRLLALKQVAQAQPADSQDGMLREAVVNVARYYLRLAATKTPAEMEALIWQRDSSDGVDHGQSCAAFASLTLELAAQVVGQQSWVTGGSSYPWPLHDWADVRVDPNPDSLQIMSVLQDARAQHRWRPLGDGYQPQAGDWVMFDGHVEVVTSYASGVLDTIGGDSLPNFSVNAHQYGGPLAAHGVTGFVDNGGLADHHRGNGTGRCRDRLGRGRKGEGPGATTALPGRVPGARRPARSGGGRRGHPGVRRPLPALAGRPARAVRAIRPAGAAPGSAGEPPVTP